MISTFKSLSTCKTHSGAFALTAVHEFVVKYLRDFTTEQPSTDILEDGDIKVVVIGEEGRIEYAISGKVAGDT